MRESINGAGGRDAKEQMNIQKLLATLLIIPTLGHAFTPTYTVTVLPFPAGYTRELIYDINNQGDSIGVTLDNYDNAVLIHQGKAIDIVPSATANSYSNAINNFGVVTGAFCNGQKFLGFIYNRGKLVSFEPAANSLETDPTDINDLRQIVGYFSPAGFPLNTNDHIFLRQPDGAYEDLGAFGTDPRALINDQGVILIDALDGSPASSLTPQTTYLRHPGSTKLEELPSLVPGASVNAECINQLGVVVGDAFIDDKNQVDHAFVYFNGKMRDLGVLPGAKYSVAESINDLGQIVGTSVQPPTETTNPDGNTTFNPGFRHAWIYYGGTMHDLNTMLSASSSGWVINVAWSINDKGQIVCDGTFQEGQGGQPVLLTPDAIMPSIIP
jgi:probable HAF family extracellular repeat protein